MKTERRKYWNRIGKKYASNWKGGARRFLSWQELGFIEKAIGFQKNKKHLKALDLGFGTGRILSFFEKNKSIASIYGVDFSKSMLNFCRNKFQKSKKIKKLILADVSKKLPFKNSSFDLITTIRVIKYSQNWQEILKECFRVLKKNGILVFEMPNKKSINRCARYDALIYLTTERELKTVLEEIGFQIFKIEGGPVLPGLVYDHLRHQRLTRLIFSFERILKFFLGPVLFSRFIYLVCRKK